MESPFNFCKKFAKQAVTPGEQMGLFYTINNMGCLPIDASNINIILINEHQLQNRERCGARAR